MSSAFGIPAPETVGVRAAHADMVSRLTKPGAEIKGQMTARKLIMLQEAINQVIVATTLLDRVKKVAIYNKPEDAELVALLYATNILPNITTPPKGWDEAVLTFSASDFHLIHMAVGIAGEAGELLDRVANDVCEDETNRNRENLIEELGDLEFFLAGLRNAEKITREDSLFHNWVKLIKKRYPDGVYSDKAAQERADKSTNENSSS